MEGNPRFAHPILNISFQQQAELLHGALQVPLVAFENFTLIAFLQEVGEDVSVDESGPAVSQHFASLHEKLSVVIVHAFELLLKFQA